MKKLFLIIPAILGISLTSCDTATPPKTTTPPTPIEPFEFNIDDWEQVDSVRDCYYWDEDYTEDSWSVSLEDDKIIIEQYYTDWKEPRFEFNVEKGYLIGENYGEFGGRLYFISYIGN
ncbi:MAG: hypothetical protein FWF82_04705, partial [Oscillospiraceae bacterium]|nr:hypothetical protein [Oscillospiraceae bacterium]